MPQPSSTRLELIRERHRLYLAARAAKPAAAEPEDDDKDDEDLVETLAGLEPERPGLLETFDAEERAEEAELGPRDDDAGFADDMEDSIDG